jgi:hypothetical protein
MIPDGAVLAAVTGLMTLEVPIGAECRGHDASIDSDTPRHGGKLVRSSRNPREGTMIEACGEAAQRNPLIAA